ncbi:hypothetical protein POTOM_032856 [Populus tomentosa]|uniref:NAD(P)-binding domain-containing protein n=1 Tax=Populus tomentosa TaxID=118781 RepID=A0A8X7Z4P6_POPTO|nr:hypothetical protein POTOM_032856 [Populus tomentosa]
MSGEGKVVCVTGGSGYIASWLVKLLLLRGYTVKATVRDPRYDDLYSDDPKRTEHLLNLDGAKERLHLFKANLVEEGSFDPVVDGCESVFHVASPVLLGTNDPQLRFVDVRDVAYAHIQALEIPSASGRYCLVGRVAHFSDAVKIAHELYPTLPLPENVKVIGLLAVGDHNPDRTLFLYRCADDKPSPLNYEVSKAKAETLGLDFTPLEVSVKDTIESLKEKDLLNV